jgi:hypothetical protein
MHRCGVSTCVARSRENSHSSTDIMQKKTLTVVAISVSI